VAFLPNNTEINGLAAIFDPAKYDTSSGLFVDDAYHVNGVEYAATGDVPDRLIDNRGIFWMPRLNFAWDVKADGDLVVRGGAGVFYNRAQGNAEYDVMRVPPNAFSSIYQPWDGFTTSQLRDRSLHDTGRAEPHLRERGRRRLPPRHQHEPLGRQADLR
jgi:hypothetical protein